MTTKCPEVSIADLISKDWSTGDAVFIRYYITSKPITLEEANTALIHREFGYADIEVDYELDAYSEWTLNEWREDLKIGGHNLIVELKTYLGSFAIIVVEHIPPSVAQVNEVVGIECEVTLI
jgi:hypothetical protein